MADSVIMSLNTPRSYGEQLYLTKWWARWCPLLADERSPSTSSRELQVTIWGYLLEKKEERKFHDALSYAEIGIPGLYL